MMHHECVLWCVLCSSQSSIEKKDLFAFPCKSRFCLLFLDRNECSAMISFVNRLNFIRYDDCANYECFSNEIDSVFVITARLHRYRTVDGERLANVSFLGINKCVNLIYIVSSLIWVMIRLCASSFGADDVAPHTNSNAATHMVVAARRRRCAAQFIFDAARHANKHLSNYYLIHFFIRIATCVYHLMRYLLSFISNWGHRNCMCNALVFKTWNYCESLGCVASSTFYSIFV